MLANLENGEVGVGNFPPVWRPITAVFQVLAPGDHVIVCDDVYHGTRAVLNQNYDAMGLECTYVDVTNPRHVCDARTTQTPGWSGWEPRRTPRMLICDIAEIVQRVRDSNPGLQTISISVLDNTWATPVLTNPLDLGADLVMHSCHKIHRRSQRYPGRSAPSHARTRPTRRHPKTLQKKTGAVASPSETAGCWFEA